MSKDAPVPTVSPAVLFRRRVALVLYLVFLSLCLTGAEGPWWEIWVGERRVAEAKRGPDFLRYEIVHPEASDPTDLMAKYTILKRENSITPARLVGLCCLLALFVLVYDLIGDHDLQLPLFLFALVIAGTATYVVYRVWTDNSFIEETLQQTVGAELSTPASVNTSGAQAAAAGRLPVWKPLWGYALFVSSALVLLLDSLYLTFFAQRGEA